MGDERRGVHTEGVTRTRDRREASSGANPSSHHKAH